MVDASVALKWMFRSRDDEANMEVDHAVAMEDERALLVTADERYGRKAHRIGRIVRLHDFGSSAGVVHPRPTSDKPRRRP